MTTRLLLSPGANASAPNSTHLKSLDTVADLHQIAQHFPPATLKSAERIQLGVQVLEKFGEAHFAFYQQTYQLTRQEHKTIFSQAGAYAKGFTRWEALDEKTCQQDVDLVRGRFKDAKFHLLTTLEENHRTHPIVEIEGKRYFFYSQAYKGPLVTADYIAQYQACQQQECRPDFQVVEGNGRTVFLMEFMCESTPNFRDEHHLDLLIELIVRKSSAKKGLDMLPCRLAFKNQKLYCVDQKHSYGNYATEFEAFKENIKMLKGKITYRGYAEEGQLLAHVDKVAQTHLISLFEKSLASIRFGYEIRNQIPPDSLNSDEKIYLAAAALRTLGTRGLFYVGRDYGLSVEDQKTARALAGNGLIENTVKWDDKIPDFYKELRDKTDKFLQENRLEGKFATYLNHVGNYKDVLTVAIDGAIFVVREVEPTYIKDYESRKEREHRPDFFRFPLENGNYLFLAKFMGSQTLDYSNTDHLDMIFDLALSFSGEGKDTIDFNAGNLVVEGNQLFYIDKDLTYAASELPTLTNYENILSSIDTNLHTTVDRVRSRAYIQKKLQ